MPERSTESKIHIRVEEGLHRRLPIHCAGLDTTIQDFVVKSVRQVRVDPHRKSSCMAGVERLVEGTGPSDEPSFFERANERRAR